MVVSNRNLLFRRSIFRCYVSFRECNYQCISPILLSGWTRPFVLACFSLLSVPWSNSIVRLFKRPLHKDSGRENEKRMRTYEFEICEDILTCRFFIHKEHEYVLYVPVFHDWFKTQIYKYVYVTFPDVFLWIQRKCLALADFFAVISLNPVLCFPVPLWHWQAWHQPCGEAYLFGVAHLCLFRGMLVLLVGSSWNDVLKLPLPYSLEVKQGSLKIG